MNAHVFSDHVLAVDAGLRQTACVIARDLGRPLRRGERRTVIITELNRIRAKRAILRELVVQIYRLENELKLEVVEARNQ